MPSTAPGPRPVIIEAAINGVTRRKTNPNVPIDPDEIARDALACLEAGATVVHNHIDRVRIDGQEAAARYAEGWAAVRAHRPDALLYPTSNFGATVADSYSHIEPLVARAGLRIGIADPGSANLGRVVYVNSPGDIDYQLGLCRRLGLGPSMAIFEPGFLRTALARWRAGGIPQGAMLKLYLCGAHSYADPPYGLPPTSASVEMYVAMLEECDLPWSVAVIGGEITDGDVAATALELGGHLHVGLEDHGGARQPTNVELVTEAADLVRRAGLCLASTTETVEILDLPAAGVSDG